MEKPSSHWKNSKLKYTHNPISKIRTLIQNLDQELMDLCGQCTLPKKKASATSNIHRLLAPMGGKTKPSASTRWLSPVNAHKSSTNNQRCISPTSLLATVKDVTGGVNVRTLSSIYRAKVIDAYRNRRIFTVYGNYHTIRRALLRRGWLEKLAPGRYPKLSVLTEEVLLQHAKKGNEFEAVAISKIINHFPAFFIWQPKGFRDLSADVLPYRNRVRRSQQLDFSTKVGLIGCAEQEHWFRFSGVCGMSHPRFYRLRNSDERTEFIDEFRKTQCRNLIRFVIENSVNPAEIVDEDEGSILPSSVLRYAMNCIKRQLSDWEHNTLDDDDGQTDFDQNEWKQFLTSSNNIIHGKGKLKSTVKELNDFVAIAKGYLEKIEEKCPEYKWDGVRNLWILKPGYQCRGIGIIVRNALDDILQYSSNNANRKYIVQKYVGT